MTIGEDRVRKSFNPSNNQLVDRFKDDTAGLIDACDKCLTMAKDSEEKRLWALAMTQYEEAAMWAVKAATQR